MDDGRFDQANLLPVKQGMNVGGGKGSPRGLATSDLLPTKQSSGGASSNQRPTKEPKSGD
jgi:hypothetical protein